jgi:hypothetical protein
MSLLTEHSPKPTTIGQILEILFTAALVVAPWVFISLI